MGRGPLEDVTRCHVTRRVTTAPYGVRREGAREVGVVVQARRSGRMRVKMGGREGDSDKEARRKIVLGVGCGTGEGVG